MEEIKIHRTLHHHNIVHFELFLEDEKNVYILLEMCKNKSMAELLHRRKTLTELEVRYYLLQLIAGLKYLHQERVIHRDFKLGNLFLTDKMEIKIADFGLAAKVGFEGDRRKTICGTPNYIAPEVIDGKLGYSYQVDIWSLGVIIYTLLFGKSPFETSDIKATYKRIKSNAYGFPEHITVSNDAKDLISNILNINPVIRPNLDQILHHKFLFGKLIPEILPISTLTSPPSLSYLSQYIKTLSRPKSTLRNIQLESISPSRKLEHGKKPIGLIKCPTVSSIKTISKSKTENVVHVIKWVDSYMKYGLGYLLSNRCYGVQFRDSTKIIVYPDEK